MTEFSIYHHGTLYTHEEKTVLGWCGDERYKGFGLTAFMHGLMNAFECADDHHFARLERGFNDYAAAWRRYRAGSLTAREELSKALGDKLPALTEPWWNTGHLRAGADVMVEKDVSAEIVAASMYLIEATDSSFAPAA